MKVYEYILRIKDQASDRISRFVRNIDSSKAKVDRFNNSLGQAWSASNMLSGGLARLAAIAGPAVIAATLTAAAFSASKLAREFEQTRISFEVMIGSVKQGRALLRDIEEMAVITPFKSSDLQSSGKLLLGYGVSAQKILPTLRMLGDISGGNAEKLHFLSLAFAQSQAAGRLMGQDLLQMVNAGFNPLQTISEKTGISIGVLKKKMEEGAISAKIVEAAFRSATQEGGRFYGMMEKQSQTFEGRMNAMSEKTEIWMRGIGQNINAFLAPLLDVAIEKMDELLDKGGKMVNDANKQRDSFRDLATNIRPLIAEYEKLRYSSKLTADEQTRLNELTKKIGVAVPFATESWDGYGNVLRIDSQKARQFIDDQEKLFELQNTQAQQEVLKNLTELRKKKEFAEGFMRRNQMGMFDNTSIQSNKFQKSGLGALKDISEEETRLKNQLSQLRSDRVKAYLKEKKEGPVDDWKQIGNEINSKGKKAKDGVDRITGGGKQPINVTINVTTLNGIANVEEVNGQLEINELMKMMEKAATEAVIRVINSGNYASAQ